MGFEGTPFSPCPAADAAGQPCFRVLLRSRVALGEVQSHGICQSQEENAQGGARWSTVPETSHRGERDQVRQPAPLLFRRAQKATALAAGGCARDDNRRQEESQLRYGLGGFSKHALLFASPVMCVGTWMFDLRLDQNQSLSRGWDAPLCLAFCVRISRLVFSSFWPQGASNTPFVSVMFQTNDHVLCARCML